MKPLITIGMAICYMTLTSCNNNGTFDINEYIEYSDYETETSSNDIRIPYTLHGGVKNIKCLLNGTILTDMILDSGCSGTLIPIEEAHYLYSKGVLTEEDFMGTSQAMIADGSIVENMVFNIRSLVIGGELECKDVTVTVSANPGAPLLLGNEILDRLPKYTVDNINQEIIFSLR